MPEETGGGGGRTTAVLAIGAAFGIAMAVASMVELHGERRLLANDVVAAVNGVAIRTVDYQRAVSGLASDRRSQLTDGDRRHVLDRLIEEELLVQYGVELGLIHSDRRVRGDLVSAVLAAQVAAVDGYEPSAQEMRDFFQEHADFFSTPGRLRLAVLWVRGEPARTAADALSRAGDAVAALRGGLEFAAAQERWGDTQVAPLPDGYLPPAKVREYVGPTVANAALDLEPGGVSDPILSGGGLYVVQVVDREMRKTPGFDEVAAQVRAEMTRRAGDDAVRSTLDRLRADGEVVVAAELP